jgi:hypothetical protein
MAKEMRESQSEPGCIAQLLAMLLMFIGAPGAGFLIAAELAPQSDMARMVGLAAMLVGLFVGAFLWLGTLFLALLWRLLLLPFRLLLRLVRGPAPDRKVADREMPSGSIVFWPVMTAVCLVAGLIIGALSETAGILLATAIFGSVGVVYGLVLWRMARSGYLDPVMEGILQSSLG